MGLTRILIVEDEALSGMYMQLVLEKAGYRVVGVEISGEEAIRSAAQEPPDLALVDISLAGEMNGIEAAGILREDFGVPTLFVTAYTIDEVMEKDKGLKASDVITKPVKGEQLRERIETKLRQEGRL